VGEDSFGNKYYENMAYQIGAPPACGRGTRLRLRARARPSGAPTPDAPRAAQAATGGWSSPTRTTTARAACRASGTVRCCGAWAGASDRERSRLPPCAGWLHQVTDAAPTRVAQYHPPYEAPALSGKYGSVGYGQASAMSPSPEVHFPKGHAKAGRKSWTRFTEWKPAAQ
jgi:NADH:ubiquinone oxidoreductase subunit